VLHLVHSIGPRGGRNQPQQHKDNRYNKIRSRQLVNLAILVVGKDVEKDSGEGVQERHDADKDVKLRRRRHVTSHLQRRVAIALLLIPVIHFERIREVRRDSSSRVIEAFVAEINRAVIRCSSSKCKDCYDNLNEFNEPTRLLDNFCVSHHAELINFVH